MLTERNNAAATCLLENFHQSVRGDAVETLQRNQKFQLAPCRCTASAKNFAEDLLVEGAVAAETSDLIAHVENEKSAISRQSVRQSSKQSSKESPHQFTER